MRWFSRWYGANPLHLLTMIGCAALAGYAALRFPPRDAVTIAIWFGGAVLGHDLVLMPLYSLADRSATAVFRHRAGALPFVPGVNYVRVPAALSGLLLLIWFPLIFRLSHRYTPATTLSDAPYLRHWLAVTAALFLASAVLFALRLRPRRRLRAAYLRQQAGGYDDSGSAPLDEYEHGGYPRSDRYARNGYPEPSGYDHGGYPGPADHGGYFEPDRFEGGYPRPPRGEHAPWQADPGWVPPGQRGWDPPAEPDRPGTGQPGWPPQAGPRWPQAEDPRWPQAEDPGRPQAEDPGRPGRASPRRPGTPDPGRPRTDHRDRPRQAEALGPRPAGPGGQEDWRRPPSDPRHRRR